MKLQRALVARFLASSPSRGSVSSEFSHITRNDSKEKKRGVRQQAA